MKSIIIPLHSFVDVITNSSSEVFVTADKKTVATVKEILKLFLENANVSTPVDRVFNVKLVYNNNPDEEVIDDADDYENGPKSIEVSVKEEHKGNYGELVKLMNDLNNAFSGEEYAN